MTSCELKRSVKRSLDDPAPPHTKHTKTAVPPQITESSQVEGRAVVGRRVRDLVGPHGAHDFVLLERARVVLVDHAEDLARRRQEVEAELEVVLARGAVPALALLLEVLEALGQAAVDRRLPLFLC